VTNGIAVRMAVLTCVQVASRNTSWHRKRRKHQPGTKSQVTRNKYNSDRRNGIKEPFFTYSDTHRQSPLLPVTRTSYFLFLMPSLWIKGARIIDPAANAMA
jgi:hypothetical protein